MIVKKMPIFQGFPDFESVKKLSNSFVQTENFAPVFYDIETTGLSQYSTFLYLIGAVVHEDGQWVLYQWFSPSGTEEKEVLESFSAFVKNYTCTIQYNGNHFDQPYLEARLRAWDLPSPFGNMPSIDLYQSLKPCKELLKLPRMKQPDLEEFLHLPKRLFCDGKEGIRCYKKYQKTRDEDLLRELLGHNLEDLTGLGSVWRMLAYRMLYIGNYQPSHAEIQEENLLLSLTLPVSIPILFSNGNRNFYISGEGTLVKILVPLTEGRLRQYYPDYRNYDYIPSEDMAMPKSLSAYLDKNLRIPAKADTCFTWFSCSESFLSDPKRQAQYLKHTLPYFLGTLK